jgi:hypothetical protein
VLGWCLNHDPFHFTQGDLIAGAVVELGGLGAFVGGDLLGLLGGAAVFEVVVMPVARKLWQQIGETLIGKKTAKRPRSTESLLQFALFSYTIIYII